MNNDILSIKQIIFNSTAINQNEIFTEIAKLAKKLGYITDPKSLIQGFFDREKETSTGLEDGFAIPHAKIADIKKPAVFFVRLQKPIKWKTFDDSDVSVVIALLIPSTNANEAHLSILSSIATKLLNKDIREQLKTTKNKEIIKNSLLNNESTEIQTKQDFKGYVIALTSCAAGVAHTYMAASKLETYAAEHNYFIKVEKQGANGIEDKLTANDVKNANVMIMATDVAPIESDRFKDIPVLKIPVAEPLHNVDKVFEKALAMKREVVDQQIPWQKNKAKQNHEKGWFKTRFKNGAGGLKNAVLTGISYVVPVIVAGTAIQAFITIIIQIAGANTITAHANWLNTLSDVSGKTLSLLLAPILSAYIAYALADKPGLTPGFLGGLACDFVKKTSGNATIVDGLGFLGGLITGILAGYLMILFKKYIVNRKIQGVLTWFVYPVFGSLIIMCVILFVIGQPIALLISVIFSGLSSLQKSNLAAILGIILGLMCVSDLGGPFNKVAWAFSVTSFSQANSGGALTNPSLLVPYACFWAAGIGTGWTTTLVTTIGKKYSNKYEQDAGKMSWILSSLGITEGAIPFALSDPFRVIPSFMVGGAISGGLCAGFNLGSSILGGGFITMAGMQATNGAFSVGIAILIWFLSAIIGCAVSTGLILGLRKLHTKPKIEQKVKIVFFTAFSFGLYNFLKNNKIKNKKAR